MYNWSKYLQINDYRFVRNVSIYQWNVVLINSSDKLISKY